MYLKEITTYVLPVTYVASASSGMRGLVPVHLICGVVKEHLQEGGEDSMKLRSWMAALV